MEYDGTNMQESAMIMDDLVAAAAAIAPAATPYHRTDVETRYSIIALHKDGQSKSTIARKLHVNRSTVTRWIEHYNDTKSVKDSPRKGQPRFTDDSTDTNIVVSALVQPFTSPHQIRR